MTITNIEQSNKAIVFVDASVHRENLLVSRDNDTNTIYATRNEQDQFRAGPFLEPQIITAGTYSLLTFIEISPQSITANIGGWTRTGRPLVAGFTVKAGDVVDLGHLDFARTPPL